MNTCSNHPDTGSECQCRTCGRYYCKECIHEGTRVCHGCFYKAAVIIIIIMVIFSYTAWFRLF